MKNGHQLLELGKKERNNLIENSATLNCLNFGPQGLGMWGDEEENLMLTLTNHRVLLLQGDHLLIDLL